MAKAKDWVNIKENILKEMEAQVEKYQGIQEELNH